MSYLSFKSISNTSSNQSSTSPAQGSLCSAFSKWLMTNHGTSYFDEIKRQHARPNAKKFSQTISSSSPTSPMEKPLVGIVGGGFAGLYSGLILQSLGIEFEIFEGSDRVGGRIDTWFSTEYDPSDKNKSGLYGELGGMRLPQFSADMLPVQQLALCVNSVLERNGLNNQVVNWRKFYYDSPEQRLRYNNMPRPTTAADASLNTLNFDKDSGGDIPEIWMTEKTDANGDKYLPVNKVLDQVNRPFIKAINKSFSQGFELMMQYDQYSMWDYLTTVFTLGNLEEYYDPAMGSKSDFLPFSVASYLETTNVGTGMYAVSFVEMVIAVYDWGGSKDPYHLLDQSIYMLTVDQGMQRFPDACETVLNLNNDAVKKQDGVTAQIQVGMLKGTDNKYSYNPPNLTADARPVDAPNIPKTKNHNICSPITQQRVFKNHKVVQMEYDETLFSDHGGMKVKVLDESSCANSAGAVIDKTYPYVISTLPNGDYLNGELESNLLNKISFSKAQAIREVNYMPAFKAFLTFKTQFWQNKERQHEGVGAASTDRPNRQIVYPSYGYEADKGVLQIYCWAQDARKLGALSDKERINECLKGIQYLYPEVDVLTEFSGYDNEVNTKTWFWDTHSGGGAFALFDPDQFKNLYATLLTPEFNGSLNIAGEACSVHHGWIVGALDSAYNAVLHILQQAGATDKIQQMKDTWGVFSSPDIAPNAKLASEMEYATLYNEVDRNAASKAPGLSKSIYGDAGLVFNGNVPAFVAEYSKVPQTMKKTLRDKQVLDMLNNQWDENVALRSEIQKYKPPFDPTNKTAVEILEGIYYGDNFQSIPAPLFWLKDDEEFARQQLAGFMPNMLSRVCLDKVELIIQQENIPNPEALGPLKNIAFIADYRQYLEACTTTPVDFYLAKPIIFFEVNKNSELMPVGIQLEKSGELFTPNMPNAENAWLLAKMQTNCAGQTLHDVGFHQLLTHQICAMVSVSLFSEEVFNPATLPLSNIAFQEHPIFKLLRPHVVKTTEFQHTIYNRDYHPDLKPFPDTRTVNGSPGVYNIGFVYDLIFSCGRIGNYQLQDKMYYDNGNFRFLDLAIPQNSIDRGVVETPFSYAYVHDATHWYNAISAFITEFVDTYYSGGDSAVANDTQLQRFFSKLIPAFNHIEGSTEQAQRFPSEVKTTQLLKQVLTMFVWQFSVQHTVINDGAYNQAAFVPNASTMMLPLPSTNSNKWTAENVLSSMPSQIKKYPELGNMNFMDVQINASVTGQGPYPETVVGRGVLTPSIDVMQDSYAFNDPALRNVVGNFYQGVREVGLAIEQRQGRDIAEYYRINPTSKNVPETVVFNLLAPVNVMNTIQT